MAYTNNVEGDNSIRIEFTANSTITELITAINDFMINHGWILHDNDGNGLADDKSKVYKAPLFETSNYKYVEINLESNGYILMKVSDSWDNELHQIGNLSYLSDNIQYAQRCDLVNGFNLYIFAHQRWLGMFSDLNSDLGDETYNMPTFCLEHTRDFLEDDDNNINFPPFAWLNLGLYLDILIINHYRMSPPIYGEHVTNNAAYRTGVFTDNFILIYHTGTVTNLYGYPTGVNPITQKQDVSPVRSSGRFYFITGRFFGLKALGRNSAVWGDTAIIPCDTQYMLEQSGINKNHNCFLFQDKFTMALPK